MADSSLTHPAPSRPLHAILAGETVGALAAADFGLRPAAPVRLIQHGLNDHYALQTATGAYVVRVYRHGWRTDADVAWELGLVDHLARAGAPVAGCVARPQGGWFSTLVAPEGERQLAVFHRLPGHYTHFGATGRHRISPAACPDAFGRSVAAVHAAADGYTSAAPRFALDLDHLIDTPLGAVAAIFAHRDRDLVAIRALAEQLRQRITAGGGPADWGPCHGDMSGGNSTFWRGAVYHFDFDCGGPGWRGYDLGVFLWSLTINGHGAEVWDPFLDGYTAVRSVTADDLARVPAFAALRVIWLMGLWCANADRFGTHTLHDDYLDREVDRLRRLAARALT